MATTHDVPRAVSPTTQAYHELQLAFDFFNRELFGGTLPPCFITLQRKGSRTRGYFSPGRFATAAGTVVDEIALNPRHFKSSSFAGVLSTLAHEMCHAWQHHHGDCHPRAGYDDREFGGVMLHIGLHPSHTGEPGGRMLGQQMSHYIIPGGRFDIAVQKLRAMLPELTWFDVDAANVLPKGLAGSDLIGAPMSRSGRRTVYRCFTCGLRAESKSNAFIICGTCELQMVPVGLR